MTFYNGNNMNVGRRLSQVEASQISWLVHTYGTSATLSSLGIHSRQVLRDALRADTTPMMSELIRARLQYMNMPPEASERPSVRSLAEAINKV